MKTKLLLIFAFSTICSIALCSEAPKEGKGRDIIPNPARAASATLKEASTSWFSGFRAGFILDESRNAGRTIRQSSNNNDSEAPRVNASLLAAHGADAQAGSDLPDAPLPARVLPNIDEVPRVQVERQPRIIPQRFMRHSAGYQLAMRLR